MTPKEKAHNLIDKIIDYTPVDYPTGCTTEEANKISLADVKVCKQIANVFVEEMLTCLGELRMDINNPKWGESVDYWNEVKLEINNL